MRLHSPLSLLLVTAFMVSQVVSAQGTPQDFQDGKNLGKVLNPSIKSGITTGAASQTSPWITTSPSQSGFYNPATGTVSSGAAAVKLNCAALPNDPICAGVNQSQVPLTRPSVTLTDPALAGRTSIANPTGVVGSVTGNYSACVTQTRTVSTAIYDKQYCNQYFNRVEDQICPKTLSVVVQYQCPGGTISGPTRKVDPTTGVPSWTCEVPGSNTQYICPTGWSGPSLMIVPPATTVQFGCYDPATGTRQLAQLATVVTTKIIDAVPIETDQWDNQCKLLEERVPAGYLLPDGVDLPAVPPTITPDRFVSACSRKTSVCTQAPETRLINDLQVTRACWQYTNTFDCLNIDADWDCSKPPVGQCTTPGPVCAEYDAFAKPQNCTHQRWDYTCLVRPAVNETIANCNSQTFCSDGKCWESGSPPDGDFAAAVSSLEATRQGGKYFDASGLTLFKGYPNTCVKKLGGIVDCCHRGGTNAWSSFNNASVAINAASSVGKALFSTYTYDALFTADAPGLILSGFEGLFGTGFSSSLAGVLTGNLAVGDFISSLIPGPWTVAMLAIQYSGLLSCTDAQKVTAMKRDANLCVDLGDYCSKCIRLFGKCVACIEKTRSFCCFNSRLAKIINTQGRAQLGRSFGTPDAPNCSGFTPDELQALDWSQINLREFYAEINPSLGNSGAAQNTTATTTKCYFGGGQCIP
jgi:conjugal transfer mating pair stabilization protein TraN